MHRNSGASSFLELLVPRSDATPNGCLTATSATPVQHLWKTARTPVERLTATCVADESGLFMEGVAVEVNAEDDALLMAEGFSLGVDEVPREVELGEGETEGAEAQFGAIIDTCLIEGLSLIEHAAQRRVERHLVLTEIELIIQLNEPPPERELRRHAVA